MKSLLAGKLLIGILLVCLIGCNSMPNEHTAGTSLPADEESTGFAPISPPAAVESPEYSSQEDIQAERKTESEMQEAGQVSDILRNNTVDMTIIVTLDNLVMEENSESQTGACDPGESLSLSHRITELTYKTPLFSASQEFCDLYFYGDGSACVIEFSGDRDEGYRLKIYNADETVPNQQYLLESGLLKWVPVREGQKLFIMDLPRIPIEEILEVYPDAILPEGTLEVEWPGGYTVMLWSREPLYNVKICGTSYAGFTEDGTPLYHPVDWASAEGFDLVPGKPLFSSMVSIGSSYIRAFGFTDSQDQEHIYLLGENGRGGDGSTLMFYVTENVQFIPFEAD